MSAGLDSEAVGSSFIKSALPPAIEITQRVAEPIGMEACGSEIENRHLCAGRTDKGAASRHRNEDSEISIGSRLYSVGQISHEQTDISESMIFAESGGSED